MQIVSGNPMSDSATIKRTDMKRTFLYKPSDLTARHDSQRKEVLFFADPHFLFFNFIAATHLAQCASKIEDKLSSSLTCFQ